MEIGNNLKMMRKLKNLSLRDAGKLLNMSAPAVAKYENGKIIPNSKRLIEFANAYNVRTIDILKTYDLPKMKFDSFRKRKKLSGKNLELLEDVIQNEVAKYFEVLKLDEFGNLYLPLPNYKCNSLIDAENAAEMFRKNVMEISNKLPISNITNTLEVLGIIVIYIKNMNNKFNEFDGLSEIVNDKPVIVLLDDMHDGARQRFTIAHELGHLVLNFESNDDKINVEKMCNRFASALLMPKEVTIKQFGKTRKKINFYELSIFKKEYKVSYAAIIYRLHDLDIISEYLYRSLNIFINKIIGKNDPNPINPEKSYQFKRIVYKLEANAVISLSRACELLGVNADEYYQEDNNYRY